MPAINNQLIRGDALAVLRGLPGDIVDIGITSPPYNKGGRHKGWLVNKVVYDGAGDDMPEADYQQNQAQVLDEVFRITKPGGAFFYNHKIRWHRGGMLHPMDWLRKTGWTVRQEIIWDRAIAANIRGWRFWQVDERVYWLHKPKGGDIIGAELQSKDAKLTSVWRAAPENKNPHPAPFPLWLPARAIIAAAGAMQLDGGLVFDPYIGSGTTAVAAKLLGFDYLGIDKSADYLAAAESRINNAEGERGKINEELALHTINKTFTERKTRNEHTGRFRPAANTFATDGALLKPGRSAIS